MAISFRCECGKKLSAKDELAGRSVRCPACSTVLKIPVPQVEPREKPEDVYALEEAFTAARAGLPQTEGPDTTRQSSRRSVDSFQDGRSAFKLPPEEGNASPREYLYLVLSLALIPLMISFLSPKETSIEARLKAAMDHAGAETISRIKALETREDADLDDLLEVLPEGKLDATAHLPRATWAHWVYGAIAAAGVLGLHAAPLSRREKNAASSASCGSVHGHRRHPAAARLPVRRIGHSGSVGARPGRDPGRLLPHQVHRLVVCIGGRPELEPAA